MSKRNYLNYVLISLLTLMLLSCDPSTQILFTVENKTAHPILIDFTTSKQFQAYSKYQNLQLPILVDSFTSKTLFDWYEMKNMKDYTSYCNNFFQEFEILDRDSNRINTADYNGNDWEYSVSEETFTTKKVEYRLVIEDADLVIDRTIKLQDRPGETRK